MNKSLVTELLKMLLSSPGLPFYDVSQTGVTELKFKDSNGKRFRIKIHND